MTPDAGSALWSERVSERSDNPLLRHQDAVRLIGAGALLPQNLSYAPWQTEQSRGFVGPTFLRDCHRVVKQPDGEYSQEPVQGYEIRFPYDPEEFCFLLNNRRSPNQFNPHLRRALEAVRSQLQAEGLEVLGSAYGKLLYDDTGRPQLDRNSHLVIRVAATPEVEPALIRVNAKIEEAKTQAHDASLAAQYAAR